MDPNQVSKPTGRKQLSASTISALPTSYCYWCCMWATPYQTTLLKYATVPVNAYVFLVIGLWFLWRRRRNASTVASVQLAFKIVRDKMMKHPKSQYAEYRKIPAVYLMDYVWDVMKLEDVHARDTATREIWPKVVALLAKDSRIRQVLFKNRGEQVTTWERIPSGLKSTEQQCRSVSSSSSATSSNASSSSNTSSSTSVSLSEMGGRKVITWKMAAIMGLGGLVCFVLLYLLISHFQTIKYCPNEAGLSEEDIVMMGHHGCTPCPEHGVCGLEGNLIACHTPFLMDDDKSDCVENRAIQRKAIKMVKDVKHLVHNHMAQFCTSIVPGWGATDMEYDPEETEIFTTFDLESLQLSVKCISKWTNVKEFEHIFKRALTLLTKSRFFIVSTEVGDTNNSLQLHATIRALPTSYCYWCMWAAPYQTTLWEYATVLVIACVFLVIGLLCLWRRRHNAFTDASVQSACKIVRDKLIKLSKSQQAEN